MARIPLLTVKKTHFHFILLLIEVIWDLVSFETQSIRILKEIQHSLLQSLPVQMRKLMHREGKPLKNVWGIRSQQTSTVLVSGQLVNGLWSLCCPYSANTAQKLPYAIINGWVWLYANKTLFINTEDWIWPVSHSFLTPVLEQEGILTSDSASYSNI